METIGYPASDIARRDTCRSTDPSEEYALGLHVFALFLILVCGTAASTFPVLVKAFPRFAASQHALLISRHFGTGVLIALAFVHLLPTAFENLWNECLPSFWTTGYNAMPGLIAMLSALLVILVEMGFALKGVRHLHGIQAIGEGEESLIDKEQEQRMILQCLLLEAGILFHSVFIGLSISLSNGTTFIALVVAIAFHQIFEGLALGARIAAIASARISNPRTWAMCLAVRARSAPPRRLERLLITSQYGLTCPLGQAIGLGIRTTYDSEGETGLLVVGIANAVSAGMIMYAGLVQLLGEDLLSEASYSKLTLQTRAEAVFAVLLGCCLMAMIAIWA